MRKRRPIKEHGRSKKMRNSLNTFKNMAKEAGALFQSLQVLVYSFSTSIFGEEVHNYIYIYILMYEFLNSYSQSKTFMHSRTY